MISQKLIRRVMFETGLTREQTQTALAAAWVCMRQSIREGQTLCFRDFGTFTPVTWRGRWISNPKLHSWYGVPDRQSVHFRPSAELRTEMKIWAKEWRR